MSRASDDEFERKIVANVREHGCHINYVSGSDDGDPPFGYSVGFPETVGQPEVIVFGLPQDVTVFVINQTLRQCRDGLQLIDDEAVSGLLEGHDCVVCAIPPENIIRDYFNSAIWFHKLITGEPLTQAVQLVWPGPDDGLFPWEDGCAEITQAMQICLFAEPLGS